MSRTSVFELKITWKQFSKLLWLKQLSRIFLLFQEVVPTFFFFQTFFFFFYMYMIVWSSQNQEHWRLPIFKFMSTFLRSPSSKELHKVSCLILGVKLFQIKGFCILCISSINCFENEVIDVRYTISDNAIMFWRLLFPLLVKYFPFSINLKHLAY